MRETKVVDTVAKKKIRSCHECRRRHTRCDDKLPCRLCASNNKICIRPPPKDHRAQVVEFVDFTPDELEYLYSVLEIPRDGEGKGR